MIIEEHSAPSREEHLVKITFVMPEKERAEDVGAENLWAESLERGHFRLESIPFYFYGVSRGDTVDANRANGHLLFQNVVARGGHSTYRVLIKDPAGTESSGFEAFWKRLSAIGCSYEPARHCWVAIDVPPKTDIYDVYELMEAGKSEGVWTFEEAHCGHKV